MKKFWKNILTKIQSPVVWTAFLAQVLLIVGYFRPELSDTVKIIGTVFIESLTLFGILNDPNNREGF